MQRPEQALHRQVADFLSVALGGNAWFTTIPVGGGGKLRGAILHGLGVKQGCPDLVIVDGGRALFIELKAAKGSVSPEQTECHAALRRAGASVTVCRTIEDVDAALIRWGVLFNARVLA